VRVIDRRGLGFLHVAGDRVPGIQSPPDTHGRGLLAGSTSVVTVLLQHCALHCY